MIKLYMDRWLYVQCGYNGRIDRYEMMKCE